MTDTPTPREIIAAAFYNVAWQGNIVGTPTGTAWDVASKREREPYYRRADAALSALSEHGWELERVPQTTEPPSERELERLRARRVIPVPEEEPR